MLLKTSVVLYKANTYIRMYIISLLLQIIMSYIPQLCLVRIKQQDNFQ